MQIENFMPEKSSKKKRQASLPHLRGKLLAFNISPKGHIEGAVVKTATGSPIQINFPKHEAEALVREMRVGGEIDIEADFETDEGDHPVYLATGRGASEAEARGKVVRLNYALHGEVNGCHLDDGTFVHVKPEGARRYKLRVGEKVKATGERRTGTDAVVLEAHAVERLGNGRARAART
jgi:hypothetical protein